MMLTLRIENFDVLDHGGPTSITLNQNGCDAGRGKSMDWILPDPARHISSHHFSVAWRDGAYWLTDMSTNGTFLQGSPHRLQGAHKIVGGERFSIGHYVVVAELAGAPVPQPSLQPGPPIAAQPAPQQSHSQGFDDPWDFGTSNEPVNPLPLRSDPHHLDDVAQDFVPAPLPMPNPSAASVPPQPLQTPPVPPPAQNGDAIVRAFCEGVGLNPADYSAANAEHLVRELGAVVQLATREIMTMLQDRAAVKQFTKGGERTMRSATGNNPMKFLPDAQQAIETMFLRPRDGFMTGQDGFRNALNDIRRHQTAVFAALQPSLAALLSGLSPDEIEDSAGSGLLGGASKSKLWEAFVERWDAKAETGEHGLLDAFLIAFAKAYAEAVGQAVD